MCGLPIRKIVFTTFRGGWYRAYFKKRYTYEPQNYGLLQSDVNAQGKLYRSHTDVWFTLVFRASSPQIYHAISLGCHSANDRHIYVKPHPSWRFPRYWNVRSIYPSKFLEFLNSNFLLWFVIMGPSLYWQIMLNVLEDYLIASGISYGRIDGSIQGRLRQKVPYPSDACIWMMTVHMDLLFVLKEIMQTVFLFLPAHSGLWLRSFAPALVDLHDE